jgi:hypothetical protein
MMTEEASPRFRAQLRSQLGFLERSCAAYDAGHTEEAVRIATVIRTLLHDSRNSTSLLTHLGRRNIRLHSIVPPMPFQEGVAAGFEVFAGMGIMCLGGGVTEFRPALSESSYHGFLPTDDWWRQIVWVIPAMPRLSRRAIVLTAPDKDGGAHVDRELPPEYVALQDPGGSRIRLVDESGPTKTLALGDVQAVCLREMAYEILTSDELVESVGPEERQH